MIWIKPCPQSEREKPRSLPITTSSRPPTSLWQQSFVIRTNRMFCSFTVRCSSAIHATSSAGDGRSSTVETSIGFSCLPLLLKLPSLKFRSLFSDFRFFDFNEFPICWLAVLSGFLLFEGLPCLTVLQMDSSLATWPLSCVVALPAGVFFFRASQFGHLPCSEER